MSYRRSHIAGMGYELPGDVVYSDELEERLAPMYRALKLPLGTLEEMTGIRERRFWPVGTSLTRACASAVRAALADSGVPLRHIGALVYCGVHRENLEPATACHVAAALLADGLALDGRAALFDVSNACLGMVTGLLTVARQIELGEIEAGIVVACERSREIVEIAIARMNEEPTLDSFRLRFATLTGGSGAVAIVISNEEFASGRRRLVASAQRQAAAHHDICVWGFESRTGTPAPQAALGADALSARVEFMRTDAVAVLEHGLVLGRETWNDFLPQLGDRPPTKTICHQVGSKHREKILQAISIDPSLDFAAYPYLGNTGSVALPLAAALAQEQGFVGPGDRVAFLGIGSGLSCAMVAVDW